MTPEATFDVANAVNNTVHVPEATGGILTMTFKYNHIKRDGGKAEVLWDWGDLDKAKRMPEYSFQYDRTKPAAEGTPFVGPTRETEIDFYLGDKLVASLQQKSPRVVAYFVYTGGENGNSLIYVESEGC